MVIVGKQLRASVRACDDESWLRNRLSSNGSEHVARIFEMGDFVEGKLPFAFGIIIIFPSRTRRTSPSNDHITGLPNLAERARVCTCPWYRQHQTKMQGQ